MKLTIFGATGPTGVEMVTQAIAADHQVIAVARRPDAVTLSDPCLDVVPADVMDVPLPRAAFEGSDVVLSALGSRDLKGPTTVYSVGTTAILDGMQRTGVRRFVGVSAAPVAPSAERSALDRTLVHPLLWRFFGGGYADMAAMERLLVDSGADWTVFRPPRLTNGLATGKYRTAVGRPLAHCWNLRRADLATAMLASVADRSLHDKAVAIAN
ncbi:MAG: NAD(P)-dependent oxidoreductase [Acidimicrobiales bacterium]